MKEEIADPKKEHGELEMSAAQVSAALREEVVALKKENEDLAEQVRQESGHANSNGVEWQFASGGSWTSKPPEVNGIIQALHDGAPPGWELAASHQVERGGVRCGPAGDDSDQHVRHANGVPEHGAARRFPRRVQGSVPREARRRIRDRVRLWPECGLRVSGQHFMYVCFPL